jgi:tRNA-Thr(GGU) m(6)t(6)A37 methyltransferase TsaA
MKFHCLVALAGTCMAVWFLSAAWCDNPAVAEGQFTVYPIGTVRKASGRTTIVLDSKYQPGLLGLDGFTHIHVLYWFDRNDTPAKRSILQVYPRGDKRNPLCGVFATRSPARPNLIALSLCKVVAVRESVLEVDRIDAFDGTPVLDIKPYIHSTDAAAKARHPEWLKPHI